MKYKGTLGQCDMQQWPEGRTRYDSLLPVYKISSLFSTSDSVFAYNLVFLPFALPDSVFFHPLFIHSIQQ